MRNGTLLDWKTIRETVLAAGRRRATLPAVGLLVLTTLMAVFPNAIAQYPPEEADPTTILEPPSSEHWLGTDVNGMDVFSRIIWGARIDLVIAAVGTGIGLLLGTIIGGWAGYFAERPGIGGSASNLMLRTTDVIQAFPPLVLGLALMAVLGRDIFNIIYVVGFVQIPLFLRLTRSAVISVKEQPFVDAARCSGNSEFQVIMRHLLPNSLTPALVNVSVAMGSAILWAAGLSFLGVGVPPPTPEWGYMVAVGARSLYTGQWWPALFPGIYIGLVTLSLAVVGDAVREHIDPTRG